MRPFRVDEKLILRCPHLPGQADMVSYRGRADSGRQAVVWTGTGQITVPIEWLSHTKNEAPRELTLARG